MCYYIYIIPLLFISNSKSFAAKLKTSLNQKKSYNWAKS